MPIIDFQMGKERRSLDIRNLVIAGWTGRDPESVEKHIAELVAIGVRRPRTTPTFYCAGANLMSAAGTIDVLGRDSSGEAEAVLIVADGETFVGLGSDHTDRKVERYDVAVSKQMCPKPISPALWKLEEVEPHWDRLELRSWVTRKGMRRSYQEGCVARLLSSSELLLRYASQPHTRQGCTAIFMGTLPVLGEIQGGELFEMELNDPVMSRCLKHEYAIQELPWVE